jgi:(+)-pinoresinol hydroxylase
MRKLSFLLFPACALLLGVWAPRLQAQQGDSDQGQRVKSEWVTTPVDGSGQPRGYVQFQEYCSACHGKGVDKPGTLALQAKYKGEKPAMLEERTDLSPQLVKLYVRNGITVMPFFRKTEINDADLDAIAAYLTRNTKQ